MLSKLTEIVNNPRGAEMVEELPGKNLPEYVEGLPVGEIIRVLKGLRYGYVQIIVQDSKVVQIDRTEKTRLDRQDSGLSDRRRALNRNQRERG